MYSIAIAIIVPLTIPGFLSYQNIGSVETLRFQQIANDLLSEGTVPVHPNRPCALRWCCITFSGNYRSRGDATAAGAEALRAVAQKER